MNFMEKIKQLFSKPNSKSSNITTPTCPSSEIKTHCVVLKNNIPDKMENFKECHYKFLRRLNKRSVKEMFSGIIADEVNPTLFIPKLIDLGLVEISPYSVSLSLLKNDSLKEILRNNNLKISGNKKDLINRISDNISESIVRQNPHYSDFYLLTTAGQESLRSALEKSEDEKRLFFINTVKMISEHSLDEAYRKICRRNMENYAYHGLGVNWEEKYKDGISQNDKTRYEQLLNSVSDLPVASTAIFALMSGDSSWEIKKIFELLFPEHSFDAVSDTLSVFYATSELLDLKEISIEKYQILSALDSKTCDICGELDGKIFPVKNAVIGVNFPPFHQGCRCTTIPYYDDTPTEELTRVARNPETGKTYKVPANMTWKEWKEKYL